nr:integrase, catalytic region, zinc finger, CCHC-type, peptidase aspartic, catalytic [Tanacetum cinerariifolium]
MLIYARAPLFLLAEAVATACFTQNRSIIRLHHDKTPYELLHNKLPDLSYFHVFGALCYPTNDSENLGKLQPKADIVVYDVLKLTPFYKAFLVIAGILEIYMQEFWATATVHHHSIRFKMKNKKRIVNLEYFREILQICLRIPNQQFDELPFEEEILAFLKQLVHITNKFLSGKSTGYDSLRLSQAQILWGMYHKKNLDFAYLLWEDFVYQVEHKDAKKSNEMYYPQFTKVIVNFFMTKDQSILRRNKVNWHFDRDDHMFTILKLVYKHQNTQQYDAILHVELTNEAIRNSESYKEYYAIASGAEPPKTKASVRTKQSSSDTIMPPLAATAKRLKTSVKVGKPVKEKQPAKSSKAKGLTELTEFSTHGEEDKYEESFDPIVQTPSQVENIDDEDNDKDSHGMNVEGDEMDDEGANEEDEANELYRDVNINLVGQDVQMEDVQTTQVIEDTHVTLTPVNPEANDLSKLELKKILINKMESNKSIHRSDEQKNLYKSLVDAYECDKLILDTYGYTVTLKRRRDDEDKDEEPSAGSNRGSKRRRARKEP